MTTKNTLLAIAMFALSSFGLLVAEELLRHPEHHVGYNPHWFAALPGLAIACCLAARPVGKLSKYMLILGALELIAVLIIDRFSLLLQYEEWIKRGLLK